MAVYRKQPTYFNVPGKQQRQSQSFVPFAGLEINDNPLLNTQSSASDMLNMVVDDNYFLTLRPRLENDPIFEKEYAKLKEILITQGYPYYYIKDLIKVKDSYLVSVAFKYEEDGDYVELFVYELKDEQEINTLTIYTDNEYPFAMDQFFSFDNFIINVEMGYLRFVHKKTGASFVWSLPNFEYIPEMGVPYAPIYKANILSKDTLQSSPIYEDLNVLSDKYRIGFQFTSGQEDTFRILGSTATEIDGDPYTLSRVADFNQSVSPLVIFVRMRYFNLSFTRDSANDGYIGGVFYYRWLSSGSSYVTKAPYVMPGSSIYSYPALVDITTSNNSIGDVTITSIPAINKDDIISVNNNEIIYVDGGKASAILNACPTRIKANGVWYNRKYADDNTFYGNYYYAWESASLDRCYTSSSVNPIDMYVGNTVYLNSGSAMVSTYVVQEVDWPFEMAVPFYKINTITKFSYQFFKLYVGVDGPLGEYISRSDFLKLYSPIIQYDNNGKRLGKFIYDSSSNVILRVYTGTNQLLRTAKNGGSEPLASFTTTAPAIRQITVYTYLIGDIECTSKTLKINDSVSMPDTTAYDRWRVHYFDGQVVVVFDGTFRGIANLGFSVMRTDTDPIKPNFYLFQDVITGATTTFAGGTTTITPKMVRYNPTAAAMFEIVSHIVWDGTNVYTISPYIFPELFNLVGTQPVIDATDTVDSAKVRIYINGGISTSINLTATSGKTLATCRRNGSHLYGTQLVLYSVSNATGYIKPDIIIIDLVALAATRGYTLPIAHSWGVYSIVNLEIGIGGDISTILLVESEYRFATYIINHDYNNAVDDYFVFTPFVGIPSMDTYPYRDTYVVVTSTGGIHILETYDNPIYFTYLISNNSINPLKLTNEAVDAYNTARNAYTDIKHPLINNSYVGDSRIYYKDNYLFITKGSNYEYLPVIYSHRPQRKIRHISPYLREVGAIFEQNMIEFVTMVENPFVANSFINHATIPLFEKYEQLAIDYTDSKHLVTFFGSTVYLNSGGLYSLTFEPNTSQDNVRKATLVSKVINTKLTKEDTSKAILANSDPYLLIMFPDETKQKTKVYAYRADYQHWYYWELPIVVLNVQDDNLHLRLQYSDKGTKHLAYFTDLPIKVDIDDSLSSFTGSVERYLDFDKTVIPWYWKSQLLGLGSITKQKQLIETYFTFVNNNAKIEVNTEENFDVVSRYITIQQFGVRYFTYNDIVTVSPKVEFQDDLNIINNIRQRTYLSRFNYCQLLCYNIDKESQILDKVRLANIVMVYKYLTGGK